jgi:hypothetical protein
LLLDALLKGATVENVTGRSVRSFEKQGKEERELRLKLLANGQISLSVSAGEDIVVDAVELMTALAKECLCSHSEAHH